MLDFAWTHPGDLDLERKNRIFFPSLSSVSSFEKLTVPWAKMKESVIGGVDGLKEDQIIRFSFPEKGKQL